MTDQQQSGVMVVRRLALGDLPGVAGKRLHVPPGRTALVTDGAGRTRRLAPGRHKVIGFWRGLFGRVSDYSFALLPSEPFPLRVPVPRLRSGDGGWVDVDLLARLRVADVERAAAAIAGEVELAADLSAALEDGATKAVAGWASSDLAKPEVSARLAAALRPALVAQLGELGLALERIVSVEAIPSEEAPARAQRLSALETALASSEMGRRMSALTDEAEWLDFVRQVEADYELEPGTLQRTMGADVIAEAEAAAAVGAAPVAAVAEPEPEAAPGVVARAAAEAAAPEEAAALPAEPQVPPAERLREAVSGHETAQQAGLIARVLRLGGRKPRPQAPIVVWWERAAPWLRVIGAVILIASMVVFAVLPRTTTPDRVAAAIQLACAIPGAIVLFIGALWAERSAARKRAVREAEAQRGQRLWELGRGERERMDGLVRTQLATELKDAIPTLRDARDHAFREGRRTDALAIKGVEERADRLRLTVAGQVAGQAAYLTEAKVSREQLETMVEYDERLLAAAADIGDLVEALRQKALADEPTHDVLARVQSGLSALDHKFRARTRFIQALDITEPQEV